MHEEGKGGFWYQSLQSVPVMGKPKTAFIVSYNPAEYVKEYLWDLDSLSINTVLSQPQSVEQILKTFAQK